jgi:hypothetical protein
MNFTEIEQLISFLDKSLSRGAGCDGTRRFIREWTLTRGHDPDDVFDFLERFGVGCDCEVLLNVEPMIW